MFLCTKFCAKHSSHALSHVTITMNPWAGIVIFSVCPPWKQAATRPKSQSWSVKAKGELWFV